MATATMREAERAELEERLARRMRDLQHLTREQRREVAAKRLDEIARLFDCA